MSRLFAFAMSLRRSAMILDQGISLPFPGRILQTHSLRAARAIPFSVFLFGFPFSLSRSESHLSVERGFFFFFFTSKYKRGSTRSPFSLISLPNLLVSLMTCSSALPARSLAVASVLRIMFQIPPKVLGCYRMLQDVTHSLIISTDLLSSCSITSSPLKVPHSSSDISLPVCLRRLTVSE